MFRPPSRLLRAAVAVLLLAGAGSGGAGCGGASCGGADRVEDGAGRPFTVAVASSLAPAVEALAARWDGRGAGRPRLTVGATSTLARQLERGAPFEVFLSADDLWLDRLAAAALVDPATEVELGRGRLVVAVRAAEDAAEDAGAGQLPEGRWASGDPAHVPLGRFAREALRARGAWAEASTRMIAAGDARAALRLVESGEVDWGILYRTDAAASEVLLVDQEFDPAHHPAIRYAGALGPDASPGALAFLEALASEEGAALLAHHGFDPPRGGGVRR